MQRRGVVGEVGEDAVLRAALVVHKALRARTITILEWKMDECQEVMKECIQNPLPGAKQLWYYKGRYSNAPVDRAVVHARASAPPTCAGARSRSCSALRETHQ